MKRTLTSIALLVLSLSAAAQDPCGLAGVTVTVNPPNAVPGQPIEVVLTNASTQLIQLPSTCTFQAVYSGPACSGTPVFSPWCFTVITPVPPGTSSSQFWDQLDNNGNQVPDGVYSFEINYYYDVHNPYGCCTSITIGGQPGVSYCFGDGSGTPCPCGNNGGPGEGCANGTGSGAVLSASGSASVTAADLVLSGSGLIGGESGLYFQADNEINGGNGSIFGDGLRCAGGSLIRLQLRVAGVSDSSSTTIDIGAKGGVAAGDRKLYQLWYRDPVSSPCSTYFNLTNGYEISWTP